jgi:hypothetical protein
MSRPVEIRLVGDSTSATGAINRTERELRQLDRTAVGVDGRMGRMFKRLGAGLLAGGAIYKVGGIIKESVNLAGSLNDAVSATEQVFGKSGKAIVGWADANNSALMMTEQQVLEAVTGFQLLLKNQGLAGKEAEKWSKTLTTLAADMSSFRGTSTADAVASLTGVMKGEYNAIEKYGVTLSEAKVKEEAYRLGLYSGKGPVSERAKAQARLNLIMDQTTKIQGDATRTEKSYANQTRRLGVNVLGLKASLGQAFIPVAEKYLPQINEFLEGINTKGGVEKLSRAFLDVGEAVEKVWDKAKELRKVFKDAGGSLSDAELKDALEGAADGAGRLAELAGKAFGAFNNMSPEAKSNIALIIAAGTAFQLARRNPVVKIGVDLVGGVITEVGKTLAGSLTSLAFPESIKIKGQPIKVTGIVADGDGTGKGGKTAVATGTKFTTAATIGAFLFPYISERLGATPWLQEKIEKVSNAAVWATGAKMVAGVFGLSNPAGWALSIAVGLDALRTEVGLLPGWQDRQEANIAAQKKRVQEAEMGIQDERGERRNGDIKLYRNQDYLARTKADEKDLVALRRELRIAAYRFTYSGIDSPSRPRPTGRSLYGGTYSSSSYGTSSSGTTVILQGVVIDPDGAARALRRVLADHDRRVGAR